MNYNHCVRCKSNPCSCPIDNKNDNKIDNNPANTNTTNPSNTNTFNPTIHVHPVVCSPQDNIVESAFRAEKDIFQNYVLEIV